MAPEELASIERRAAIFEVVAGRRGAVALALRGIFKLHKIVDYILCMIKRSSTVQQYSICTVQYCTVYILATVLYCTVQYNSATGTVQYCTVR